jgi:E3 ubiquitin-protein ligase MARCH6
MIISRSSPLTNKKDCKDMNKCQYNSLLNESKTKDTCRICYEQEINPEDKLVTPCLCQGSIKYIHNNCVKNWILNQGIIYEPKCEICKFKYKLNFSTKKTYVKEFICSFIEKLLAILFVAGVILLIVDIIIFTLVNKYNNYINYILD